MIKLSRTTFLGSNKRVFDFRGVTLTETEYKGPVSEDWHCHESNHVTLFLDGGNCEQRTTGDIQAVPGRILTYPSGMRHRNTHTRFPSKNINIEIHDEFLKANAITLPSSFKRNVLPEILDIYDECLDPNTRSEETVHALVICLLSHSSAKQIAPPAWMRTVIHMINDRWNENLSLKELAAATGNHPVTVSKAFRRFYGTTLSQYTRQIKVSKALEIARTTRMPLVQVALECGFFDQSHFIRTFKTVTGRSPKYWANLG
ncbi:MAG TPA: AraC family transcriptional regulator [Chryseolinea sp.]|nr:AraC family transcriptional regulator [Chryseolinea sp.]